MYTVHTYIHTYVHTFKAVLFNQCDQIGFSNYG
jgi:hypothetical protein